MKRYTPHTVAALVGVTLAALFVASPAAADEVATGTPPVPSTAPPADTLPPGYVEPPGECVEVEPGVWSTTGGMPLPCGPTLAEMAAADPGPPDGYDPETGAHPALPTYSEPCHPETGLTTYTMVPCGVVPEGPAPAGVPTPVDPNPAPVPAPVPAVAVVAPEVAPVSPVSAVPVVRVPWGRVR